MRMKPNFLKLTGLFIFLLVSSLGMSQQPSNLSLEQAIQLALENNYSIVISRYDTEIAEINNSWGNAGRYPTIDFNMGMNHGSTFTENGVQGSNRLTPGVGLRWVLFDGFRVTISKEKLDQIEAWTQGLEMVVVENTIEDVILAYYAILLEQEKLKVFEKVLTLAEDRYTYEQNRHELGGAVTYEVLLAKNEFLSEKALFMNQQVRLSTAVRTLNYIMGESPEQAWDLTTPFNVPQEAYQIEDVMQKMMANNQTLKNQYISMMMKKSDLGLAKSALFPSVYLNGGLNYSGNYSTADWNNGTWSGSTTPSLGLTLSYDIFNGGVRKNAIEVARINESIAGLEINELEHALTNQLYNTFDNYHVRQSLVEVASEGVEAAEMNLGIAGDKYRTGVINQFNYRDIQLIYQQAAIQYLESIFNLLASRTQLIRITGGFLSMGNEG